MRTVFGEKKADSWPFPLAAIAESP